MAGVSMGGFGVWETGEAFPETFAALASMCGGGDPTISSRLKDIPIWAFHGDNDDVVPISTEQDAVDALEKAGGNVKFTIYKGASHNCGSRPYWTEPLYSWLLEQHLHIN